MAGTVTVTEAAVLLESAGITAKNNPVLYNSAVRLAGTAAGALVGGVTGAGTAFNEANNNYLTHQQISQLAKKVAACRAARDSACVRREIAEATKSSDANSVAMRACTTRACLDRHVKAIEDAWAVYGLIKNLAQGGADVATLAFGNSKTPNEPDFRYYLDVIRQNPSLQTPFEKKFYAMDAAKRAGFEKSAFGHPLSEKERYALLTGAGGNPIQGVLADAAENYAKGLGLNKQQLAILAVAVGSIKAIKGGSPIPVPNAVLAANGLMYKSNSKHTLGMEGNRPSAGVEPSNSLALFGTSVSSGKKQYAIDEVGNIHQFSYTNDGTWHWSGRSGLDQPKQQILDLNKVPIDVRRRFGIRLKGK